MPYTHQHLFFFCFWCLFVFLSRNSYKGHLQAWEGVDEQTGSGRCEEAEPSLSNVCPGGVPQPHPAVRTKKCDFLLLRNALQVISVTTQLKSCSAISVRHVIYSTYTVGSSVGVPQVTVLSPYLFTLFTVDFTSKNESWHVQKYSNSTLTDSPSLQVLDSLSAGVAQCHFIMLVYTCLLFMSYHFRIYTCLLFMSYHFRIFKLLDNLNFPPGDE